MTFRLTPEFTNKELDSLMRGLYMDPEELEKKCHQSVYVRVSDDLSPQKSAADDRSKAFFNTKKIENIDPKYFNENFDPVRECIIEVCTWKKSEVNDMFMQRIEETDSQKDIVSSHMANQIQLSYPSLMECMRDVHAIDLDLSRAVIQVAGGRRKMKGVIDSISHGPLIVCNGNKKRNQLEMLRNTALGLKFVKDLHKAMVSNITTGDLGRAAEFARSVLQAIQSNEYAKFKSLISIGENVRKNVIVIRQKTDKALAHLCCRRFAATEYGNIVKSYLVLDDLAENLSIDIVDNTSTEPSFFESMGCLESLPQRIQRNLQEDIDGCLHTAVLELIYAGQHRKQMAAQAVAIAGAYSTMNATEMMDLAEFSLDELYQHLTPDLIAPCIVRCCELFSDSVHTHYMISQWHSTPFDDRNDDIEFLHRNEVGAGEAGSSNPVFDDSLIDDLAKNSCGSESVNHSTIIKTRLSEVHWKLGQTKSILWDDMLRALVQMLNSITVTHLVSFEDFLAVVWAVHSMIKLGKEFCDADGQPLLICLQEKSKQYFHHVHINSFNMMRQMVEADPWSIIPVRVSEYGSINKLIQSKVAIAKNDSKLLKLVVRAEQAGIGCLSTLFKDKAMENNEGSDASVDKSILTLFATYGNPFHFLTHETDSDRSDSSDVSPSKAPTVDISSIINSIFDDTESSAVSRRTQEMNDMMVVTQSVINGLARYAGKYLQMMNLMPSIGSEALQGLCQIFDFYLCYVFNAFVPGDERSKFLAKQTKMTMPAPDQCKDFEALQSYLEKVLNDVVTVRVTAREVTEDLSTQSNSQNTTKDGESPNVEVLLAAETEKLSNLLRPASMVDLDDSHCCYGLNNRIVAAESCWFAARILNDIKSKLLRCLPERYHIQGEQYITQFQLVASQLRSLIYKTMCPQLIRQHWILMQVVDGGGWDSKKLRESHHEWIEKICQYCNDVWKYMQERDDFAEASNIVREQVWLELCQCAFDTFLDGFAKIRKVSAEGRAAMTMDVAALHDGLDCIHACRTPRGKHHVDSYIRAAFYSEEDMMNWINENWQSFAYRHILGLLTQTLASVLNSKKLKDATAVIDSLYETTESAAGGDNKLSSLLSGRLKEEGGIKGMITQRLRRQSMLGGMASSKDS